VANDRARYDAALSKAHDYGWEQEWQAAIREFRAAAAEFPHEPAPYSGLGEAYAQLDQLKKALDNYKLAARYSKGDIIYLSKVCELQERLGQNREASQTYVAIGEVQWRRQLANDALANWQRAARLDPDSLAANQKLAAVYQRRGLPEEAIDAYLAMARILQGEGRNEQALQACRAALQLNPRHADVLTAIELLQHGEKLSRDLAQPATTGYTAAPPGVVGAAEPVVSPDVAAPLDLAASGLSRPFGDSELNWDESNEESSSPVQDARRLALEQLAEEIFEDEDDEGASPGRTGLSKHERDALISQALDFQTRNLVHEAIGCYEQIVTAGAGSTAVHFNLGLLYQNKLRFEDAIRQFEIAVKDNEYRLASLFALGESYRGRGRIDKALEHFIQVLKIVDLATVQHEQADRLIELYENLADSLLTKGDSERATAFANGLVDFLGRKGWEDKVKDARARLNALSGGRTMILGDMLTAGSEQVLESLYLSQEYNRRGLYNSAIEEVFRVIQLSPDYLPAHLQLADLLNRQGRVEAAALKYVTIGDTYRARSDMNGSIYAYERVAELSPLDVSIKVRLIELLKRHGRIDDALEHYLGMGETYFQLAQVDKARETYQEALKLAPRGSADRGWRARLLKLIADIDMQRFDWKRALAAYVELRKENPHEERVAITLVDLFFKIGQPDSALRELDRYLIQLVKSGRSAKVVGIMEDMVGQRPSNAGLVDRLARLYQQQKREQDAIDLLDRLGEAQLESGEKAQAVETINKILSLNPPNAASYQQLIKELKT
jgi:tetratricopeptide (TPR) repeat protein